MGRDKVHNRIDELLGLISINNNRLSLHSERLSQLDIDVLRKNCIELYEQINMLALQGKRTQVVKEEVMPVAPPKPEPVVLPKQEVIKEVEPPKVIKQAPPEPKKKLTTPPKRKPKKQPADDEMQSLFERFSSKPIASIAKAMSVAKRFEFQSNLFDGDAASFKKFISELDNATDREDAFRVYHEYKTEHEWDSEELKDELKALMYRKFA